VCGSGSRVNRRNSNIVCVSQTMFEVGREDGDNRHRLLVVLSSGGGGQCGVDRWTGTVVVSFLGSKGGRKGGVHLLRVGGCF
jgi:hypothetical protein